MWWRSSSGGSLQENEKVNQKKSVREMEVQGSLTRPTINL